MCLVWSEGENDVLDTVALKLFVIAFTIHVYCNWKYLTFNVILKIKKINGRSSSVSLWCKKHIVIVFNILTNFKIHLLLLPHHITFTFSILLFSSKSSIKLNAIKVSNDVTEQFYSLNSLTQNTLYEHQQYMIISICEMLISLFCNCFFLLWFGCQSLLRVECDFEVL